MPYPGGEYPPTTFSRVELDAWLAFWRQATADTIILLTKEYRRQQGTNFSERLWLQGLLRPEEQAKLSPARVWTDRLIERLMHEVPPARTRSTRPSTIVGYVQANTNPSARSLDHQREAIKQWCQVRRLKLVTIYEDVGISNTALLNQRPGLQAALSALTPGSALLVLNWDRLTTHLLTAVGLQQTVFQAGAAILTVMDERQKEAALPPQMMFFTLPGALIARLDRDIEQQVGISPGKPITRADAAKILLEQALTQAEVEEHAP